MVSINVEPLGCPKCGSRWSFITSKSMEETAVTKECDRICEVCGYTAPLVRRNEVYCLLCGKLLLSSDMPSGKGKKYTCSACKWVYIDKEV